MVLLGCQYIRALALACLPVRDSTQSWWAARGSSLCTLIYTDGWHEGAYSRCDYSCQDFTPFAGKTNAALVRRPDVEAFPSNFV